MNKDLKKYKRDKIKINNKKIINREEKSNLMNIMLNKIKI